MNRLLRHLFPFSAAASLVLCVLICVLWARSYWRYDVLGWKPQYEVCSVQSYCGHLFFFASLTGEGDPGEPDSLGYKSAPVEDAADYYRMIRTVADWQAAGFSYTSDLNGIRCFAAPHWSAAAATTPLPAIALASRLKRRRRTRRGCCADCGYDLRGHQGGPGRCPECGAAAAADGPEASAR